MERAGTEVVKALRASQLIKETAVRREGVGTDIPMLLHLFKGGVLLGAATLEGERERVLTTILGIVALSDADKVVHVCDAYATYKADAAPTHGDLARAFGAGNPDIVECLNAVSVHIDGTTAAIQTPYTYVGRSVEWADPIDIADDIDSEVVGDFPRAVRLGFDGQKARLTPALNPPEIAALAGCVFVVPVIRRPPRNEPCPCGSGRKAKLCCWA